MRTKVSSIILIALIWAGCEPSPPPADVPREKPIVFRVFETVKSVRIDDTGTGWMFPNAFYSYDEIAILPTEWIIIPWVIPARMVAHIYHLDWAPSDSAFTTIAIAFVDSMESGVLLFAVKDSESGDSFRLELNWKLPDSLDVPTGIGD